MRRHEENPFLQGNFAPVYEERTDDELTVMGELPKDLNGLFLRNGPNPRFAPKGTYHWFDGDGMMHGIRIAAGKASYRNRWVRTREFLIEEREQRALWGGLEDPPEFTNPHGFAKNRSNTSAVFHGGKLLSIWEGGAPYELDPVTLETKSNKPFTYEGKLQGAFTAHPKLDPETEELFVFGYSPFPPFLRYHVVSPDGELEQSQVIDLKAPVMMHDFALTEHYVVFMDLPAVMRLDRLLQRKSFIHWEPERGARFGVLPRYGKAREIRWFEVPPFYMYHTGNAYEDGHTIVLTGGRMPGTFMVAQDAALSEDERMQDAEVGVMTRFRIDLESGKVSEEQLDDVPIGFENVNELRLGRKARYNYASVLRGKRAVDGAAMVALRKYDLEKNRFETHRFPKGTLCGEGVFVPRERAQSEDDGYVLTLTHDERENVSQLCVLDARGYGKEPLARVVLKQRVPFGFHARWVSGEQLSKG